MRIAVLGGLFAGVCLVVGCARGPTSPVAGQQMSCARHGDRPLPARVGDGRQGSAVALVRGAQGLLAYVADADSHSVHTISVDQARELGRTRLPGVPRQLVVMADGRVVATLEDAARIVVLEPSGDASEPMTELCEREVEVDPWGIALSPQDAKVVVTSGWGAALTVLDGASFATDRVVALPREPRSVLVDDEGVAFVSHLVGAKLSVVDLAKLRDGASRVDLTTHKASPFAKLEDMRAKRTGSQGYALARLTLNAKERGLAPEERILAPMVSVDPGSDDRPSSVYYGPPPDPAVPKEAPFVSVIDGRRRGALASYLLSFVDQPYARECLLPRAAAIRAKTGSLLVACLGVDVVLELDALAVDPFRSERRRFPVPLGPEGVAVDDASGRVVVFSQLGGAVTLLSLDAPAGARRLVPLDYHPDPALHAVARGRELFYRTDDLRISGDGLACASCHPDGRDDAITWRTPMGPRQTPMLAGRMEGTKPYGWEGDQATLPDYIATTTMTRLGGTGLPQEDLLALAAYLEAQAGPRGLRRGQGPHGARDVDLEVARGRSIFGAEGCASCHHDGAGTDAAHHAFWPRGPSFDTPSLRFIGGTAPYFHDGKYATLEDLLADPTSGMGHTAALSLDDRFALAAYLRSL